MFQSTRPRGARPSASPSGCPGPYRFNPRAHGGRDISSTGIYTAVSKVSIHAPTGGATIISEPVVGVFNSFNPRAHGGRDPAQHCRRMFPYTFQSTRPRGARPVRDGFSGQMRTFQSTRPRGARRCWSGCGRSSRRSFNPRAHGGRDVAAPHHVLALVPVSIHAPTGGATFRGMG